MQEERGSNSCDYSGCDLVSRGRHLVPSPLGPRDLVPHSITANFNRIDTGQGKVKMKTVEISGNFVNH